MSLAAELEAMRAGLIGAGVRAVTDERHVNPPCVLLDHAPTVDPLEQLLDGHLRVVFRHWLIGQGTGDLASSSELYAQLPRVIAVLDADWTVTQAAPALFTELGQDLPALILTTEGLMKL